MARNPITTWEMLDHALQYYLSYIAGKNDKYALTVIDLIFISNFKGGNASITEPADTLTKKLEDYVKCLRKIGKKYKGKKLSSLTDDDLSNLVELGDEFLSLAKNQKTKIRGFGASYASALLSAHFGELFPVLDRRILNGAEIKVEYDSQKQVKKIEQHYGTLIKRSYQELKAQSNMTLRELDKEWFVKSLLQSATQGRQTLRYAPSLPPLSRAVSLLKPWTEYRLFQRRN
jgi:hypothetical protein